MKQAIFGEELHRVSEANVNYYATPFVHPERTMREHDFIYLIEGEWKFGQGSETYLMKKDSLLILGGGTPHKGLSPCAPGTKTMYFHAEPRAGDGDAGGIRVPVLTPTASKTVKRLFSDIVRATLSGKERRAELYLGLLLSELEESACRTPDSATAERIRSIIHESPEVFYKNTDLARMVNVSVKTAENKFKAMYGMSIHRYVLDFKIREAISYFELFPEIRIKEIAHNLGFYDEYHFSKQFKKLLGTSPEAYKKGRR